jgi:hypothetical protein
MNIVDENIPSGELSRLRNKRIPFRKIGQDLGRKGIDDEDIIPLLHSLDRPTFFTLDEDFYDRRLCHERYCLIHLDIDEELAAFFIQRILRHRALNTKAKRMGLVIRAMPNELAVWRINIKKEARLRWE